MDSSSLGAFRRLQQAAAGVLVSARRCSDSAVTC